MARYPRKNGVKKLTPARPDIFIEWQNAIRYGIARITWGNRELLWGETLAARHHPIYQHLWYYAVIPYGVSAENQIIPHPNHPHHHPARIGGANVQYDTILSLLNEEWEKQQQGVTDLTRRLQRVLENHRRITTIEPPPGLDDLTIDLGDETGPDF
jgi:hypothetical protein